MPLRVGRYLRIASAAGIVAVGGGGPRGNASAQGLGSMQAVALGGSLVPGLALAFFVHTATARADFEGGPFGDATLTVDGEELDASLKALSALTELGVLVDWYPDPAQGWHVGLSAGFGLTSLVTEADDGTLFGTGAAGGVTGGYDWSIGPQWSLGVGLTAGGVTRGQLKTVPDGEATDYELGAWWVGLQGSVVKF